MICKGKGVQIVLFMFSGISLR